MEFRDKEILESRGFFKIMGTLEPYLKAHVLPYIPPHKTCVEVFGGKGELIWNKKPSEVEVYNDLDPTLVFMFKFLKNASKETLMEIASRPMLNTKTFYNSMKEKLKNNAFKDNKDKFYTLVYLYHTYLPSGPPEKSSNRGYIGVSYKNIDKRLLNAKARIKNLIIENLDCIDVLNKYDDKDTFFFLDPPYVNRDRYYRFGLDEEKWNQLKEQLGKLEGKFFLITMDYTGFLRDIREKFHTTSFLWPKRFSSIFSHNVSGNQKCYLISNYDKEKIAKYNKENGIDWFLPSEEYYVVKKESAGDNSSEAGSIISAEKEQITYIPHFVSLVGSRARGDYDENSDWDILIRKQERDEALELLIRRTLGEDKEYHFIYSPYGPHGTYIPLFDLKLTRVKEQKPILIEAYTFRPLKNYTPPKMGSAYSFEEFYDIDELVEKWAKPFLERGMGLYVEKKLNGWRATIHKKDSKVGIFFEGTNDNRDKQFLKLSNLLKEIPEDFILDCEFSAKEVKTKKIIPRKDLAGWGHNPDKTIDIDEFETPSGVKARLSIMLFDVPYLNVDISKEPLKERRKILEDFYKGLPQELKKYMEIVPYFYVETVEDLKKAIQEVSRMEMSEGAVVKSSTSIYLPEEIPSWAKFKKIVEIKVEVMKKLKTKDGRAFNYVVGYLDDGEVKELCKTMNTKVDAEIGDIITLSAEEIIIKQDKEGNIEIGIQIPRVRDIDLNRKRPDTLEEIIQKGYKGGILQATSELISELKAQKILESKEGDTGGDWKADFMVWFEKGSKGKFVLQEHERGLSEKLAKTGRRYSGSENIHCDLRFRILRPKPLSFLVGITLATPSKPNEPNKIVEPDKGKILVVGFKKFQPISWLDVGKGKIDLGGGHVKMKLYGKEFIADINTPGGVGSTKNTWSRFVAIDEGDFEVVDKGNHHILFKFNSKNGFLDGYWVLGGAPLDTKNQNLPKFGNRVWFFQKSAKNSDIIKQEEKE